MYCAFKQLQCLSRDEARRPSCWKLYWRNVILCFNSFVTFFFFLLIHPTVRMLLCFHDSATPFYNSSLPSIFNESRGLKKKIKQKNIRKRKTHNRCFRTTLDVESRLWEHCFILSYTLIIDQCVTFPHRQTPSCKGNRGKTVFCQADSRSGWLVELSTSRVNRSSLRESNYVCKLALAALCDVTKGCFLPDSETPPGR